MSLGSANGSAHHGPSAPAAPGGWPPWASAVVVVAALCGLTLLLYAPALPPEPILDDGAVALNHGAVNSGSPPATIATYYADSYRPLWRPLATASLRANWVLAVDARPPERPAVQARAHRAVVWTQVGLFALLGALAFFWLRRIGSSLLVAGGIAALLVLHPVNAESVWRIAGRSELLGHLFLLAAFLIYAARLAPPASRHGGATVRRRPAVGWIAFAACALASLLARETALLLPVFLIGYEITLRGAWCRGPSRRPLLLALILCVALFALWAGMRAGVLAGLPDSFRLSPSFDFTRALETGERLRLALFLPWLYLRGLLLAGPLLPDYTHLIARTEDAPDVILGDPSTFGVRSPGGGEVLLGLLVLLVGMLLFFLLRRREPRAALGAWIFATSLLAVLPLLEPNGAVASLRHLFLPLLGLLLLVGTLAERGLRHLWSRAPRVWWQGALAGVLSVVILAAGWGLAREARAYTLKWTDWANYLNRLQAQAPNSPVPGFLRGTMALHQGQPEGAAEYYEETIGFFPRNPQALLNLGLIRADQEQYGVAGRILHDAAVVAGHFYPGTRMHSNSHLALATLLGRQGLDKRRIEQLHLAVAADSTNVRALGQLGVILALSYSTATEGVDLMTRALTLDREIRQRGERSPLGAFAERVRSVRERAARNLGLPADQWDTGEAGESEEQAAPAAPTGAAPGETPE